MDKNVQDSLNKQINNELHSAYMYMALSSYFDERALLGFASWMVEQCKEELLHAQKLIEFLKDNDGLLELQDIARPEVSFSSPLQAAEMAFEYERMNTKQIYKLYELSKEKHEHATMVMLQWFIEEQVEEEKTARTLVDRLKLAGEDRAALLMLDSQVAQRTSTTTTATA